MVPRGKRPAPLLHRGRRAPVRRPARRRPPGRRQPEQPLRGDGAGRGRRRPRGDAPRDRLRSRARPGPSERGAGVPGGGDHPFHRRGVECPDDGRSAGGRDRPRPRSADLPPLLAGRGALPRRRAHRPDPRRRGRRAGARGGDLLCGDDDRDRSVGCNREHRREDHRRRRASHVRRSVPAPEHRRLRVDRRARSHRPRPPQRPPHGALVGRSDALGRRVRPDGAGGDLRLRPQDGRTRRG